MTAALEGGEWSAARPGRTLPPGKDPVPILQEAGWAPGPVWTGEKSRPRRDSIPDRPARSQSLYRLSYPVYHIVLKGTQILWKTKVCYHLLSSTDENCFDLEGVEERKRQVQECQSVLHARVSTHLSFHTCFQSTTSLRSCTNITGQSTTEYNSTDSHFPPTYCNRNTAVCGHSHLSLTTSAYQCQGQILSHEPPAVPYTSVIFILKSILTLIVLMWRIG